MDLFGVIALFGGLALFLYGMSVLAEGIESLGGSRLEQILEKLTKNIFTAVLFGAVVTAAIQSSSATTVIVVGLINARALKLKNAIGVIMGANIGTTITGQILRLSEITSDNLFLQILKPTTLAPLAAIIGILIFMTAKRSTIKSFGTVLLGFGILFTGMFNMEAAVRPLRDLPQFAELFSTLSNPLVGVLAGAVVTAVIQSSSASVGILQALSVTGHITYATAFPIIMGQNIGTCVTPLLASIGASKNAKRSAVIHLSFNIIGTALFLVGIYTIQHLVGFPFWADAINKGGIADFHTFFNVVVTILFIPFAQGLSKLAHLIIPDKQEEVELADERIMLDDRIMLTPALAIEQARKAIFLMAEQAQTMYDDAVQVVGKYDIKKVERIREAENMVDRMEDRVNDYLLRLSQQDMVQGNRNVQTELLHTVSELEQLADNIVNVVGCAEELYDKRQEFSDSAKEELDKLFQATREMLHLTVDTFRDRDLSQIGRIEAYEEVVDTMEERSRQHHIDRLQNGVCTAHTAFPFVTMIAQLERVADNCSNIAVGILTYNQVDRHINRHEFMEKIHSGGIEGYEENFKALSEKYLKLKPTGVKMGGEAGSVV